MNYKICVSKCPTEKFTWKQAQLHPKKYMSKMICRNNTKAEHSSKVEQNLECCDAFYRLHGYLSPVLLHAVMTPSAMAAVRMAACMQEHF